MKTQAIWSRGQRVISGMVMRMLVAGGCVEHTAVGLSATGVSIKLTALHNLKYAFLFLSQYPSHSSLYLYFTKGMIGTKSAVLKGWQQHCTASDTFFWANSAASHVCCIEKAYSATIPPRVERSDTLYSVVPIFLTLCIRYQELTMNNIFLVQHLLI